MYVCVCMYLYILIYLFIYIYISKQIIPVYTLGGVK